MSELPPPLPNEEQRLHPWSWLFALQQQVQQFLLPLLALLVFGSRRDDDLPYHHWISGAIVLALVATAVLQYLSYRYRIGSDALSIRSGIFERTRREIPFARIHNVVVHQNLLHRMFGVAELRLESAGGDKPEAEMRVLKLAQALELEQLIRQGGSGAAATTQTEITSDGVLLSLPLSELVRQGLISNRAMVVLVAAIGAAYQLFPRRATSDFIEEQGRHAFGYASQLQLGTLTMVASGLLLLAFALVLMRLLSVGLAIVQYYGFRLSEADRRLTVERGLFTRVRSSVAQRRIQAWTLREGALHRLFKRRQLRVDIASGGQQQEQDGRALKELAPLAPPATCDGLLQHLLPQLQWPPAQWQPVSTRGWWRLCLPALLLMGSLSALLVYETGRAWGLLPLLWLPWSALKAHRQVSRIGYNIDAQRVAIRGGWWNRWWRVAELDKLQALRLDRSPLDRRFGTATLTLDTAGAAGAPALQLRFLEEAQARALMAQLEREMVRRKLRW